jgi:TatD DNase family protein
VVDTHAHLGICEPAEEELVSAAREAGVRRILDVGMDEESNKRALAVAEDHDEVFACIGRHPNQAGGFGDADAVAIEEVAAHPGVRAIGETGLDYYRYRAPREDQQRAFSAQIEIARRVKLPLVIHLRDSGDGEAVAEAFATLASRAEGVTVVLHCFSAAERLAEAVDRGWYCSFAGNVTYPKAGDLQDAARAVPDELLLVETDSPFLSPQRWRGKPNQPANVVATAEFLAELRGVPYEELQQAVEANAARLFGW